MDEFNFDENEMSTSIENLKNKKSELNDQFKSYRDIRKKLYDDITKPKIFKKKQVHKNKIKHNDKIIVRPQNKSYYFNLFIFSFIFFFVNNSYLNNYLVFSKFSYYTIVFLKLLLLLIMYYLYKFLIN